MELFLTYYPWKQYSPDFTKDKRIKGFRINNVTLDTKIIEEELTASKLSIKNAPLYLDIKGREICIRDVHHYPSKTEVTLTHKVTVDTPTEVCTKLLASKREYKGVPLLDIKGDNCLILPPSLDAPSFRVGHYVYFSAPFRIDGPIFTDEDLFSIEKAKALGFRHFILSYVESAADVALFKEKIGNAEEILLKIESKPGLRYLETEFKKEEGFSLMAGRADLFVEYGNNAEILKATKLLIEKDPSAIVGSRMLWSLREKDEALWCSDLSDLAWLHDIGYRRFMLADSFFLQHGST